MGAESLKFGEEDKGEDNLPLEKDRKRPGGPLQGKPMPLPDGWWLTPTGEKITRDAAYAWKFWESQPSGSKQAMEDSIRSCVESGTFAFFAPPEGITDDFKRKLSACRELAKEMGYEIGQFELQRGAGTVTAFIKKIE